MTFLSSRRLRVLLSERSISIFFSKKEKTAIRTIHIKSSSKSSIFFKISILARAFNWRGIEIDKILKFKNTLAGFQNLLSWIDSIKLKYNLNNTLIGVALAGHY